MTRSPLSELLNAAARRALAFACVAALCAPSATAQTTLDQLWFAKQANRLVGVGGEIVINRVVSGDDPATPGKDVDGEVGDPDGEGPIPPHLVQRLDPGDWLVGIGVTQRVECLDCPEAPQEVVLRNVGVDKSAMRAFQVRTKERTEAGYRFTFQPLTPGEYAAAVAEASGGAVKIDPATIPQGTMVVSYEDQTPEFTLAQMEGSPGSNWASATSGTRHWNVGVARPTDFWMAEFPSDDVGMLPHLPADTRVGRIGFGLSLLRGGAGEYLAMEPTRCEGPKGEVTVDVCLTGAATGTMDSGSAFPIGLSTEVRMRPSGSPPERTNAEAVRRRRPRVPR